MEDKLTVQLIAFALTLASQGKVRPTALRAFSGVSSSSFVAAGLERSRLTTARMCSSDLGKKLAALAPGIQVD